jgi:parallel beta-helix repeat protein
MITTVAFFVTISPEAEAWTPVGGYIDNDTVWTVQGSPYWVVSDVIVRNGARLGIEVGIDVLFSDYYSIYVEVGAAIWFKATPNRNYTLFSWNSAFGAPYPGRWRSIQFNDSSYDYSSIQDSVIEYATYGVRLESASPTIRKSIIRNCTYGIYSNYGCPTIKNNTIENCTEEGIHIRDNDPSGGYPKIENNTVYNNTKRGIILRDVSNARLRNNNIANSSYNFGVWALWQAKFNHDIDTSNTVNQKPIYYWRNHEHDDEAIPSDAGYVGIVNSTNITVTNLTLTNNGQGVLVAYSDNMTIDNVSITDNELGVILFSSPDNIIENSNISNNDNNGYYPWASGIYQKFSKYNKVKNNTLANNQYGITLHSGNDNIVANNSLFSNTVNGIRVGDVNSNVNNNTISYSEYGIYLYNFNNISYNNVSNCDYGIYIGILNCGNNLIKNNVSYNDYGIFLDAAHYNTISDNIAYSNIKDGIRIQFDRIGGIWSFLNVVVNNYAINNGDHGIFLDGRGYSEQHTVSNNTVSLNKHGIYLFGSNNNNITYNTVNLNDITGIYIIAASQNDVNDNNISSNKYGTILAGAGNNNINHNNISSNSDEGLIISNSNSNNIKFNTIYDNEFGIYLSSSSNNNISFCNISSNNDDGVYLTGSSSNDIYDNTITWNDRTGINCTSESDPIIKSNDIENNTWYGVWSGGGSDPVIN